MIALKISFLHNLVNITGLIILSSKVIDFFRSIYVHRRCGQMWAAFTLPDNSNRVGPDFRVQS
jgi:hypothetical protein